MKKSTLVLTSSFILVLASCGTANISSSAEITSVESTSNSSVSSIISSESSGTSEQSMTGESSLSSSLDESKTSESSVNGESSLNSESSVSSESSSSEDIPVPGQAKYSISIEQVEGLDPTTLKLQLFNETMCSDEFSVGADWKASFKYGDEHLLYVRVIGLPDSFAYDPYAVSVGQGTVTGTIKLHNVSKPTGKGDGFPYDEDLYNDYGQPIIDQETGKTKHVNGPIEVDEGVYKIDITQDLLNYDRGYFYVGFKINSTASYRITSWCDTGEGSPNKGVDPSVKFLGNTSAFFNYYGGGDDDSYEGKNFRYSFSNDQTDNIGITSFYFGITANKACSFYISFDFEEAVDPYVSYTSVPYVTQQDLSAKWPNVETTKVVTPYKMDGSLSAVFNEEDGFYHLNDKNGDLIYAMMGSNCEYFDASFYMASLEDGHFALLGHNEETKICYDYSGMIEDYYKVSNSDGLYPMTAELKTFFELLVKKNMMFEPTGTVGSVIDYTVPEDQQWLFAAYYYCAIEGGIDNPYVAEKGKNIRVACSEPSTFYYKYTATEAETITIDIKNSNTVITLDGVQYSDLGDTTDITYTFTEPGSITFKVEFIGDMGSIGFTIN